MTVSEQKANEWVAFPDAKNYQASHRGLIQSLPHKGANGRDYTGTVLKLREDGDGYLVFNYRDDNGVRHTNASVARAVLLAHDPDGRFPGAEACHGDGGQKDNRWPENIRWDTGEANRQEALEKRLANNPPKPKPAKTCPRCKAQHRDKGRNCHPCVMKIGVDGTRLLLSGMRPEGIVEELDYPLVGVINLAITYGGLRFYREGDAPSPQRRSLSVLFRRGAARQNSDAQ